MIFSVFFRHDGVDVRRCKSIQVRGQLRFVLLGVDEEELDALCPDEIVKRERLAALDRYLVVHDRKDFQGNLDGLKNRAFGAVVLRLQLVLVCLDLPKEHIPRGDIVVGGKVGFLEPLRRVASPDR